MISISNLLSGNNGVLGLNSTSPSESLLRSAAVFAFDLYLSLSLLIDTAMAPLSALVQYKLGFLGDQSVENRHHHQIHVRQVRQCLSGRSVFLWDPRLYLYVYHRDLFLYLGSWIGDWSTLFRVLWFRSCTVGHF